MNNIRWFCMLVYLTFHAIGIIWLNCGNRQCGLYLCIAQCTHRQMHFIARFNQISLNGRVLTIAEVPNFNAIGKAQQNCKLTRFPKRTNQQLCTNSCTTCKLHTFSNRLSETSKANIDFLMTLTFYCFIFALFFFPSLWWRCDYFFPCVLALKIYAEMNVKCCSVIA